MTAYLLDTNILIYLEEPNSPYHQQIVKQLSKCTDEDVLAVSVLSFYELEYGIATRTNSSNALQVEQSRKVLQEFQEGFEVLPISLNAAKRCTYLSLTTLTAILEMAKNVSDSQELVGASR